MTCPRSRVGVRGLEKWLHPSVPRTKIGFDRPRIRCATVGERARAPSCPEGADCRAAYQITRWAQSAEQP